MRLEPHEKLLLHRRRRGETQKDAAYRLGVPKKRYILWENGAMRCPRVPRLSRIKPHERCFIRRRRANMTQEELAGLLGLSTLWVAKMEMNKVPNKQLMEFWDE